MKLFVPVYIIVCPFNYKNNWVSQIQNFACLDNNDILPCSNFGNVQATKNFTRKGIVRHLNRELVCQVGPLILNFLACLTSKKDMYATTKFDSKFLIKRIRKYL